MEALIRSAAFSAMARTGAACVREWSVNMRCTRPNGNGTHSVPRHNRGKHRRVRDSQVRDAVHTEGRVDNAAVLQRGHAGRACGVVERVDEVPRELLQLCVGRLAEVMVQLGVLVAHRVHDGPQWLGMCDLVTHAQSAHERLYVVLVGEVAA